ncbi:unnamed protein product [Porites lobata]|uniref:Uncharacterized protein n=1 Tax=Porites lobata TaxID=104759 RepID=A0ABN8PVS2_9CNID|nr:unnamed protein product [Porites lobata]
MTRFLLFALLATIICFIAKTYQVEGQLTYNWKKFNRPSSGRRLPKKPGRSVFNSYTRKRAIPAGDCKNEHQSAKQSEQETDETTRRRLMFITKLLQSLT